MPTKLGGHLNFESIVYHLWMIHLDYLGLSFQILKDECQARVLIEPFQV